MYESSDEEDRQSRGCDVCMKVTGRNDCQGSTSLTHKCNVELYTFNKYKKAYAKQRDGIEVSVGTQNRIASGPLDIEINSRRGEYVSEVPETDVNDLSQGITFKFTIKVTKPNKYILMKCHILHPHIIFQYNDITGYLARDQMPLFEVNATYSVSLTCFAKDIGEYRMPISFWFKDNEKKDHDFSIIKEMVIKVFNNNLERLNEIHERSPFTNQVFTGVYTTMPTIDNVKAICFYPIPKECDGALTSCLRYYRRITLQDRNMTDFICNIIANKIPTRENYQKFFHYLLWLDEKGAELKISKYNMENVKVNLLQNNIVELAVPGLAEKRPSLIRGDTVKIRVHLGSVMYCGAIKEVCDKVIKIHKFDPAFIHIVETCPDAIYDVAFEIGRLVFERMHRAVDLTASENKLDMLFPELGKNYSNINRQFNLSDSDFKDQNITRNREQKEAVINILNASSENVPYIVFGPPGTGKTVTIVEAIVQIVRKMPKSKVLVCAPANAACDMIAIKLSKYFTNKELIRIHSEVCDWKNVPDEIKPYSNRKDNLYNKISGGDLQQNYKIVVTTLMSAGRYARSFTATHVFIDEAAQAMEPEALIAVGGILKCNGQLILAGDPKQLGPICNSKGAEENGLNVSLLSRLMDIPLYKPDMNCNNSKYFITKLLQNYRNHPDILKLPNEIFYESHLQPVSDIPLRDRINKIVIPVNKERIKPQAVEFYGVNGVETREGKSPSYFNQKEIEVVMKYLHALTSPQAEVRVKPEEIGIVVPYIRQHYRIRNRLRDNLAGIEVGTTETFQGREKRVMIISTVRAQASLLLHDKKYNIGFVSNPQRFNVAITRAISKLIIVGNPQCLNYDKNWLKMINFCRELNSYRGFYIKPRDDSDRNIILDNLSYLKYDKHQPTNNSNANNNGRNRNNRRR